MIVTLLINIHFYISTSIYTLLYTIIHCYILLYTIIYNIIYYYTLLYPITYFFCFVLWLKIKMSCVEYGGITVLTTYIIHNIYNKGNKTRTMHKEN